MRKSFVVLYLLISCFATDLSASHLLACFSSYKHLALDSYEIKFSFVRDRSTSGADSYPVIFVQVYTFDGTSYVFEANLVVSKNDGSNINIDQGVQESIADEFLIRLDRNDYSFEYQLTNPNVDYHFVYQRCCREENTNNLSNPSETGISLSTIITSEAQAVQNSSIEFNHLPPFIAIANMESEITIDAVSLDGDDLTYQLSPNFIGGGLEGNNGPGSGNPFSCEGVFPQGPCPPPYEQISYNFTEGNFFNPFPGWENQGMDAMTGRLLGVPQLTGQYSYGFSIHESRDGQIINTTSFDYVVFVLPFASSTEKIVENKLTLKGNPSTASFIVENTSEVELNYGVYNLKGEHIDIEIGRDNQLVKIEFEGPAGMYILKAYNEEFKQSLKLIKL